jgi:4-amino-4-deoxy-L-arabinose transferase-like glycosyltransferase
MNGAESQPESKDSAPAEKNPAFPRVLVALGLALAGLAYLAYQAFLSPEIEFLRPSSKAHWVVHPNPPFILDFLPRIYDAVFTRQFLLDKVPASMKVRISAKGTMIVRINGHSFETVSSRSWKKRRTYDLAPFVYAGRMNSLRIEVDGLNGPPALLVGGPEAVRTDNRWTVALGPDFNDPQAAVLALRGESYLEQRLNPLRASSKFPLYLLGFVIYALGIVYSLVPLRLKPWIRHENLQPGKTRASFLRRHGLVLVVMLVVVIIQLHNVFLFPYDRSSFDWQGHVEYVQYVAQHWRPPLANEGWQMYQPPLYYYISALAYKLFGGEAALAVSLKAVQVVTTLAGLGNIALAWWLLCLLFPGQTRARTLGFSVAALLPLGFYMNPMVSNEIFAGTVIGLAIVLAVRFGFENELRWRHAFLIGAACGLALLSKYTGLFIFASILFLLVLRHVKRQGNWKRSLVLAAVVLALCGWFYGRNIVIFKDPFVGNWDKASGSYYEQAPGYRNLSFYTRLGSWLTQLPERTKWLSFWDGDYASMWTDPEGTFLSPDERMTNILASLCLWLAVLPSVAILLGLGQAVVHLIRRKWDHPFFLLVLTTLLTLAAAISFSLEVPFFSTIKAFFFLSLLSSVAVFAALGLETMSRQLGRLRWLLYANLATLYGMIVYLFWYRGT